MNFGHWTIWYNHEDHVWDIYDGRCGLRDKLGFLDTDKNHRRFWRVMRWWDRLRHGRR
jgi:hypothetical protein